TGSAQVVRGEGDVRGALQGGDRLSPAVAGAPGFLRGEDERAHGHRLCRNDGAHQVGERYLVLLAHFRVRRRQQQAIGQDTIAGKLGDLAATCTGEQEKTDDVSERAAAV